MYLYMRLMMQMQEMQECCDSQGNPISQSTEMSPLVSMLFQTFLYPFSIKFYNASLIIASKGMKNMKKTKMGRFRSSFFLLGAFLLACRVIVQCSCSILSFTQTVSETFSVFVIFLLYQCIEITKQPVPSLYCECYRTCN